MRPHSRVETIEKPVKLRCQRTDQDLIHADRCESIQIIRELRRRRQDAFNVSPSLRPLRRKSRVHAMRYPEAVEIPLTPRRHFSYPSDSLRAPLRIHPRAMPSVAELDRPPYRAAAYTSDPNRNRARRRT